MSKISGHRNWIAWRVLRNGLSPCPGCGWQVTDRAAYGRPVHVELSHAPGCTRLARDQAAENQRRRDRLPRQVVHSEDAMDSVPRHWLRGRITDDSPRCGWYGYFHHYLVTVDGDWAAAICDDCYADLHPGITVTAKFISARFGGSEPFAVIQQRDRSDHDYPDIGHFPDIGQQRTWRLSWEHTSKLVEEAHGGADEDIAEIAAPRPSRSPPAGPSVTGRPMRPGCPGWLAPTRDDTAQHTPQPRGNT